VACKQEAFVDVSDIADEELDHRCLGIASDITALVTKNAMSPKHLGLAVHLHHGHGSRTLVEDMHTLGYPYI
jgi:hypothetical protein